MYSRKTERKKLRKQKKQRKAQFYVKKHTSSTSSTQNPSAKKSVSVRPNKGVSTKMKVKTEEVQQKLTRNKKQLSNLEKISLSNKKRQQTLIKEEERYIKQLEKKLKLNRRKKKGTLPKSFHEDGLAYILDVVDKSVLNTEESKTKEEETEIPMKSNDAIEDLKDSDFEQATESEEGSSENSDVERSDSEDNIDNKRKFHSKHKVTKMDIYGKYRDSLGNIVDETSQLVKGIENKNFEISPQLTRMVRGALNRLTTANIAVVTQQIAKLYLEHSRFEVSEAVWSCIKSSVIDLKFLAPSKLVSEHAMLIALLHAQIGEEVGGQMIHNTVCEFEQEVTNLNEASDTDSKRIDNIICLTNNLLVCGLLDSNVSFDVLTRLCDLFREKCIELIILTLRSVGFYLRKENPVRLKELILTAQQKASTIDKNKLSGSRINFMLEALTAIKNNNIVKLPDYGTNIDFQLIENTLKGVYKKVRVNKIPGSYNEILNNARWWIYSTSDRIQVYIAEKSENTSLSKVNERLCKMLRFNTPLRKELFHALITSDDYQDASRGLVKIARNQAIEVVNVVLHVAIHEKQVNLFYVHLLRQLSHMDRKYKVSMRDLCEQFVNMSETMPRSF